MEIKLNENLDWEALGREFQVSKRIQIRDILKEECAERILQCLAQEVPWRFVYYDGENPVQLTVDELKAKSQPELQSIHDGILARARSGYQYAYHTYPMVEGYLNKKDPGLYLHKVFEFINSEPYLDFIRTVTGVPEIRKGNAHAACYNPTQFLGRHNDYPPNEGWHAACVLNFTKGWKPDWGGFMQFYDNDFNIDLALMPRFNVLNMFVAPQEHSVSYVAPFAGTPRYTVTTFFQE